MDVPGAAGIEAGLDGAKDVLAGRTCQEFAVSLKVRIPVRDRAPRMNVCAIVVGLPDLNQSVTQRSSITAEYASVQPGNLADRRCNVVVDANQIVIQIERHPVGIIRPDGLRRRQDELFGEKAALREQQTSETGSFQKIAPAGRRVGSLFQVLFH